MRSDFNFHLPEIDNHIDLQLPCNKKYLDKAIHDEFNICKNNIYRKIQKAADKANNFSLSYVNFMILDESFAKNICNLKNKFELQKGHYVTVLVDPFDSLIFQQLENLKVFGISGVKFHPYLQKLKRKDFSLISKVAFAAATLGFWVTVDCSYGTGLLYEINGVELCAYLLNSGLKGNLIALHFGGPKVLDTCTLMAGFPNLYADLSLSLNYWEGSTVWEDLAFTINKIGSNKFLYGSDQPFIQLEQSLTSFNKFSAKAGLKDSTIQNILHFNFERLLER